MTSNLEWRDAVGFGGEYQVSNTGLVRSRKKGHYHVLKTKHNGVTGYDFVVLGYNGNSKTKTIHRLVAEAFIPNPNGFNHVNHKDENKLNNNASNLEWCTNSYNHEYSSYKLNKPVDCYSPDGELLATFASQTIACQFLNAAKATVNQTISGVHSSCKGFILKERSDLYGDPDSHHRAVRVRKVDEFAKLQA